MIYLNELNIKQDPLANYRYFPNDVLDDVVSSSLKTIKKLIKEKLKCIS